MYTSEKKNLKIILKNIKDLEFPEKKFFFLQFEVSYPKNLDMQYMI